MCYADHDDEVYFTDVCLLRRERVQHRTFELKHENFKFAAGKGKCFEQYLLTKHYSAYFTDMNLALNEYNYVCNVKINLNPRFVKPY